MSRDQYYQGANDEQNRRRGNQPRDDEFDQGYDEADDQGYDQGYDQEYAQEDQEGYSADEGREPTEDDEIRQLDKVLYFLRRALEEAPRAMLKGDSMRIVNVGMCMDMINNIEDLIPGAIQLAHQVIEEREQKLRDATMEANSRTQNAIARADSMIAQAAKTAQETLERARREAEQMSIDAANKAQALIDDQEVLRKAKEEADRVYNEARAKTSDEYRKAKEYVDSLLEDVERDMMAVLDVVKKSRKNIGGQ